MTVDVQTQFLRILNDFTHYLQLLKQNNTAFIDISEPSKALILEWESAVKTEKIYSQGPGNASVFLIDSTGDFYSGKSGRLLEKILAAMTLTSNAVFICNAGDEAAVGQKIAAVSPKVIITLGEAAGQSLLGTKAPVQQFRGKFFDFQGIPVMPTFHPSLLLHKPQYKRHVWEDMKQVMDYLGLKNGS